MEYTAVVSSQIAQIGYGDGVYGPETLGILFPPNKKQAAAGEPGSVYHYGNLPRTGVVSYDGLMAAESIGSYFVQNIKRHPELFPFTKVEISETIPLLTPVLRATEPDPTIPAPSAASPTQAPPHAPIVEPSSPSDPGSALALIDAMADDLLFTPGAVTDAQLEAGRQHYLTEAKKYDIATEEQRMALKRFARPLQKLRTGIEARAKELTGATKRKIAAIDAEKRRLVGIVGGIEDEVLRPLTEWEQEEDARKARLAGIVTKLAAVAQTFHPDIPTLTAEIAELESFDLSTMQEYKVGAESAIAASLRVLKPELERRRVAEVNALELERLRAESAARAEADRQAAAKAAEEARIAAAVEAAKVATRQEVIAELAAPDPEDSPKLVQAAQPFVYPEVLPPSQPVPFQSQAEGVHEEIVDALVEHCLIDRPAAHEVVAAIVAGLIPHLSITY